MGSSANVQNNLTKMPNQGGSDHQSANSPSGTLPWQNGRV